MRNSHIITVEPRLGIFWFIRDRQAVLHFLAHTVPLAEAESYGDRLTCLTGHYEMWSAWRRGRPKLPAPALAPVLAADDYEEWPRGRIVFDRPTARFVLYADRQLLTGTYSARIMAHFNLTAARTDTSTDPHYMSTRSLRSR